MVCLQFLSEDTEYFIKPFEGSNGIHWYVSEIS